jgi:hypothetical protein
MRTLQFYGKGYGATPATITVTLDGDTVYTGAVTTVDQPTVDVLPGQQVVLFTCEVPVATSGALPMTCTVNNGTVYFMYITGNYAPVPNPVYTSEQFSVLQNPASTKAQKNAIYETVAVPPLSPSDIATLESTDPADLPAQNAILLSHGCAYLVSSGAENYRDIWPGDERSNVSIDGVAQSTPNPRPPETAGTWGWTVESGSVLAFDLNIVAGRE